MISRIKKQLSIKSSNNKIIIFTVAIILGVIIVFFSLLLTKGESFYSLLFSDKSDYYMDFFNCLYYAQGVFEEGNTSMYPALAHFFFYSLYCITDPRLLADGAKAVRDSQFGVVYILIYTQILCLSLGFFVYYLMDKKINRSAALLVALILSSPWMFCLERGNILGIAWIFVGIFLAFYDSEETYKREIAIVSLAIAAGIKLYPALLGLLLLKNKQWKDSVRCICYGVVFLIAPILVTPIKSAYLNGLFNKYQNVASKFESIGYGNKVNIENVYDFTFDLLGANYSGSLVSTILKWSLIVLGLYLAWLTKKKWISWHLLIVCMYSVSSFSARYNLVYIIFPLLLFLKDNEKSKLDSLFLLLYIGCFVPVAFGGNSFFTSVAYGSPVSLQSAIAMWSSLLLFLFIEAYTAYEVLSDRNSVDAG